MKPLALKFLLPAFLLMPVLATAQDSAVFLPPGRVFQPLLADPLEPQSSLAVNPDTVHYYGSLGGTWDLARLAFPDQSLWSFGLLGSGNLDIFRYSWASYRLQDIDLWMGAYLAESQGDFSSRLQFLHGVSHLGDWLFGTPDQYGTSFNQSGESFTVQGALPWERDGVQFLEAFQPSASLRLYGGGGAWFNATPAAPPLFLHAGAELFTGTSLWGDSPWRGYFAYDLRVGYGAAGVAGQNFQAGFQLKRDKDGEAGFRAALTYSTGNSPYGQFGQQEDSHWGVGLFVDP